MVTVRDYNYSTKCARFAISSSADIANLPTQTTSGIDGEGNVIQPVKAGSSAITTSGDFKLYMLDGASNEWKERSK